MQSNPRVNPNAWTTLRQRAYSLGQLRHGTDRQTDESRCRLMPPYGGGIIKYLDAVRMTCIVALYTEGTRSAEYSRVDPGICVRGRGASPLPSRPISSLPLRSRVPLKPARRSERALQAPPSGVRDRSPPEDEFGAL